MAMCQPDEDLYLYGMYESGVFQLCLYLHTVLMVQCHSHIFSVSNMYRNNKLGILYYRCLIVSKLQQGRDSKMGYLSLHRYRITWACGYSGMASQPDEENVLQLLMLLAP